jgi:hypothetical protein
MMFFKRTHKQISQEQALAAKKRHEAELLRRSDVVGLGIGVVDGNAVINLYTDSPKSRPSFPRNLDGVPVVLKPTGRVKAS